MSLGTTDISTDIVSAALGLASHDVGTLCAKAKTGGNGGWAFSIAENGGAVSDGTLISGADPFFNKWSDNSPGEWVLPANITDNVIFRLKRDPSDSSIYGFGLDQFAGYDHSAAAPTLPSFSADAQQTTEWQTFAMQIIARLGSYNWAKIFGGVGYCRLHIFDSSNAIVAKSNIQPISLNTNINFGDINISVNTTYPGSRVYTTKIVLCQSDGSEVGLLPGYGTITYKVYQVISPVLHVSGFAPRFLQYSGDSYISNNGIHQIFTIMNDYTYSPAKSLTSITYNIYSSFDSSLLRSQNITSFDGAYDSPMTVFGFNTSDITITFDAKYGSDRIVTAGNEEYIVITMNYQ